MAATVHHSPDLGQESNPIARALLDAGHPLSLVYGFAIVCQGLYVALACALWWALLKHRTILLTSLRELRSPWAFLKAATGGGDLTWRQWLLPMRLSELPDSRSAVWVVAVMLLGSGAERWYLGLEWYGFFPGWRVSVAGGSIVLALGLYLAWLWRASRAPHPAEEAGAGGLHPPFDFADRDRR